MALKNFKRVFPAFYACLDDLEEISKVRTKNR